MASLVTHEPDLIEIEERDTHDNSFNARMDVSRNTHLGGGESFFLSISDRVASSGIQLDLAGATALRDFLNTRIPA